MLAQSGNARHQPVALIHRRCDRTVFGAWYVAELVAAPFDADGMLVVAVVRFADQVEMVADLQRLPLLADGVILAAGQRRTLDQDADALRLRSTQSQGQANRQQQTHSESIPVARRRSARSRSGSRNPPCPAR